MCMHTIVMESKTMQKRSHFVSWDWDMAFVWLTII